MLSIPEIPADADVLTAALAYAKAGLYVGPARRGSKNPGSLLGDNWQSKTSSDPEQITAWFAASDDDVFLHAGRSGLVSFDVDHADKTPAVLARHLDAAPCQSSRPDEPGRAHYLFQQPEGRTIGNGGGKLGSAWGQVRGRNGVIMLAPSVHADGGEYRWQRSGPIPVLPDEIAEKLPDAGPDSESAATPAEVLAFIAEHTTASRPGVLAGRVKGFTAALEAGNGRHDTCVPFLTGALEEARAGFYSAQAAVDAIGEPFLNAVQIGEKKRTKARAEEELNGIKSWAVAQAIVADVDAIRERVDTVLPDTEAWIANSVKKQAPPEPQPGDVVLDRVAAWFRRYICFTEDSDADLLTLWAAHTHLARELQASPRLQLDSVTFDSGKTTTLEHLERLCHNGMLATALSSALIPRLVNVQLTTILMDEVDRTLAPGKEGIGDLLAVINSGYRVGGSRPVLVATKDNQWTVEKHSTFSPLAMAGNSPQLPADTVSRSIRVLLMPDVDGEIDDTDWLLIHDDAVALGRELAQWADSVRDTVRVSAVTVDGIRGRQLEKWRTLKAVGYLAGGRWKKVADNLVAHGVAEAAAMKEAGFAHVPPRVQLLKDLHATWEGEADFISTAGLCDRLIAENPGYWGETSGYGKVLSPQRLGKMIADATKALASPEQSQRPEHGGPRGYCRTQFTTVWRRLGLPEHLVQSVHLAHSAQAGPTEPTEPTEPSEPSAPDGYSGRDSASDTTVEEPDYPLCSGGCGLPIGPVDVANGRTHHGLCA